MKFQTKLGCEVSFGEAPEHLGKGLMMIMRVEDSDRVRRTEVFLDDESLIKMENWLFFRRESKRKNDILTEDGGWPRLYCSQGHGSYRMGTEKCRVCEENL